ncbi:hypothetical protein HYS96_00505 [Candidatus Daviesbacteria bacterium]|nr:hypothetical protein [Candidatus Daviesbacteria bacterium]
MERKLPRITIEMFQPTGRSTAADRRITGLLGRAYGREGLSFFNVTRQGLEPHAQLSTATDRYFYGFIRRAYGLPENMDPQDFYLRQQRHAAEVIDSVLGRALPAYRHELGLKNEVSLYSESPADLLRLLAYPDDGINPTLKFELQRHILLSHISASFNSRTLNGRLRTELSRVQMLLNGELYGGRIGDGEDFDVYALHEDGTNSAVQVLVTARQYAREQAREICGALPEGCHLKRHPFSLRRIGETDSLVYTNPRKKSDAASILKALAKAVDNGGVIDPLSYVQDSLGIMFVAMGGGNERKELVQRVTTVLQSHPSGVEEIMEDHHVDRGRGQSEASSFTRLQLKLRDISVPLELIFYTCLGYLNSEYEVGTRDSGTGIYPGRAHDLYELRRSLPVLQVLFPPEIYQVDTRAAVLDRMVTVAEELREKHRIV